MRSVIEAQTGLESHHFFSKALISHLVLKIFWVMGGGDAAMRRSYRRIAGLLFSGVIAGLALAARLLRTKDGPVRHALIVGG